MKSRLSSIVVHSNRYSLSILIDEWEMLSQTLKQKLWGMPPWNWSIGWVTKRIHPLTCVLQPSNYSHKVRGVGDKEFIVSSLVINNPWAYPLCIKGKACGNVFHLNRMTKASYKGNPFDIKGDLVYFSKALEENFDMGDS